MDFLDQSVLPQSSQHLVLIRYLLVLSYLIFIPYVSLLFGSLSFSLFFKYRWEKKGSAEDKKFSKSVIDLITSGRGAAIALGIVPLLSSSLGYAQLLHKSGLVVPGFLFLSSILLLISLLLIYTYKYTFHLKDIFSYAGKERKKETGIEDDIENYSVKAGLLHKKSGFYGMVFLVTSLYLYFGALELASDSSRWTDWNGLVGILFSLPALISFIQFIAGSFMITAAFLLYKHYRPNSEAAPQPEIYSALIRSISLNTGLISSVIFALLFTAGILIHPVNSLSFEFFIASTSALILILFTSILYYSMLKESVVKYSSVLIYVILFIFALSVVKDQFAFSTASKYQTAVLDAEYQAHIKALEEASGTAAPINGADIYNGRCIACHNFDKKIVGPPYNQTMPKYEGKKDLLVKFILNPVKVNPDYPAMPNQGLKPKEAEAVADFLLSTYKK